MQTFKKYATYKAYIRHQASKLNEILLEGFARRFPSRSLRFQQHFQHFSKLLPGDCVLCLGARLGEEVEAFRKLGFEKSIGIDFNPGKKLNNFVFKADIHFLPFKKSSHTCIYTNVIDHVYPERVAKEVYRVLKPGGIFVLETGSEASLGDYEITTFTSVRDIRAQFSQFVTTAVIYNGKVVKGNFEIDQTVVHNRTITLIFRKAAQ